MSCTNCFNGCAETISDQCIKYTGIDIPTLGIENGDSLAVVEQAIFGFLNSILVGSSIVPIIDPLILCTIIDDNLPVCSGCTTISLNNIIESIVKSICQLKEEGDINTANIADINAPYNLGCLEGVDPTDGVHAILEATITKLCLVSDGLDTTTANLNNYVLKTELNTLIAAYLATNAPQNLAKNRMVPFVAVPYFGPITGYPTLLDNLSTTGSGSGYWDKIFICNGSNNTPDLRGRMPVGYTDGTMGGATMRIDVNPASSPLNPSYGANQYLGTNGVTLGQSQIPLHTHNNTISVVDTGHTHGLNGNLMDYNVPSGINVKTGDGFQIVTRNTSATATANIVSSIINVNQAQGGEAHPNNQPALGALYIIYIP